MARKIPIQGVLYINGKPVENTFNKLYGTTRKLERELKKLKTGTKEWQQKASLHVNAMSKVSPFQENPYNYDVTFRFHLPQVLHDIMKRLFSMLSFSLNKKSPNSV